MNKESKTLEIMRRIGAPKPEKIRISGILKSQELASLTLLLPGGNIDSSATVLKLLGDHEINIRFINVDPLLIIPTMDTASPTAPTHTIAANVIK